MSDLPTVSLLMLDFGQVAVPDSVEEHVRRCGPKSGLLDEYVQRQVSRARTAYEAGEDTSAFRPEEWSTFMAHRLLRRSSSQFLETLDPTGFRALCAEGLLREEEHPTRYRFAVTLNGWRLRFGVKV
ncbi:hypothetical protein [Methylobacterium brachiatum]|uniref:hypothetical protein n=1 Tax=Methylobacterium brachiatum TaxID=269660 RepID=UPI000EFD008E|nr:hypothetical protein [Methylobacterium brachiatum]AYO85337.1 hypothetical protein EBB05_26005 [Methylobacterium brachiatum]